MAKQIKSPVKKLSKTQMKKAKGGEGTTTAPTVPVTTHITVRKAGGTQQEY